MTLRELAGAGGIRVDAHTWVDEHFGEDRAPLLFDRAGEPKPAYQPKPDYLPKPVYLPKPDYEPKPAYHAVAAAGESRARRTPIGEPA